MKIRIKAYGIAKDIVGGTLDLEMKGTTVSDLRQTLLTQYPDLRGLSSVMVAVNQRYGENELVLKSTDEIALIPPVSGG